MSDQADQPPSSEPKPQKRKWRRWLIRALLLLIIGMAAMWFLQRLLIYPSYTVRVTPGAGEGVRGLERLWRKNGRSKTEAWFFAAPTATPDNPAPVVIFAHGNGELIEHWDTTLAFYNRWGYHLLLVEYRGYGRSTGSPSETGIVDDFLYFIDEVSQRPSVDGNKLIYHGRSLGGGVVCSLAKKRTPQALILMSSFKSIREMAKSYFMPAFLVRDPYDNLATLKKYKGPTLIIHGNRDRVVPYEHGQALAAAAPHAQFITYDAGHNDCPPDPAAWRDFQRAIRQTLIKAKMPPRR